MSEAVSNTGKQPLDEVMLAMDVVDTLRHHMKVVERELGSDLRDEQLKEKLRKIYHTQGIEVPDHVLEEGVQALREDRFTYRPPEKGLSTRLAAIYISRDRWGKWLIGVMVACLLGWGGYQFLIAGPRADAPELIKSSYHTIWHSAKSDRAKDMVKQINRRAVKALEDGDRKEVEKALAAFEEIRHYLDQEYVVKVVASPGERSGVWRVPDINRSTRNYYIIVEAVAADGQTLQVPVISEETNKKSLVSKWGIRVDEDVFQRIGADKQDDGIIQNNILGEKEKGYLDPSYTVPTNGGAITSW
ncbi:MAG: DUF6384 family protein [Thermodesulfobacteriota bacterium]